MDDEAKKSGEFFRSIMERLDGITDEQIHDVWLAVKSEYPNDSAEVRANDQFHYREAGRRISELRDG